MYFSRGVVDRAYQILVDNFDNQNNDAEVASTILNLLNQKVSPTFKKSD